MKLKKSNIVLICLAVAFFINIAVNYYIYYNVMLEKINEHREIVQSENKIISVEVKIVK